ncbi:MAG: hypothetical protein CMN30_22965 [Sandaracinus sp.]|nr:hypothetical protein [Sandaracinus sp.]|tara:strand:- start:381 stop:905 length:525 start_codon:yes stop_codon:yes gene_type:complete
MRFLLAGAAAMALIGPAASAAAEPCVCLTGIEPAAPTNFVELSLPDAAPTIGVSLLPTADDAPVSEPTLGAEALSRPLDELLSAPLFVWADATPLAAGGEPGPKVLWCEGSDDPRCQPAHGDPVSPEFTSPPPSALGATLRVAAPWGIETSPFASEGLLAARGARRELERPPRT